MKAVHPKSVPLSASVSTGTESAVVVPTIRVLKIADCPSVSGRSTLTYHVGCEAGTDASGIVFRVFRNTGSGHFCNEWVKLSEIQQAFAKVPNEIAITAHLLSPLFRGRSNNSQAFLFSILKHEGLVSTVKDRKGRFERADAGDFIAGVMTLMAADVDLEVDVTPAPVRSVKPQKLVAGFDDQPKSEGGNKKDASKGKKKAA